MDTIHSRKNRVSRSAAIGRKRRLFLMIIHIEDCRTPVMEDWELQYMQMLARIATSRNGKVLEIGYGLGLSARSAIQSHKIDSHCVIGMPSRCRHALHQRYARRDYRQPPPRFERILGEDITSLLASESFDGILLTPYPASRRRDPCQPFPGFSKEAFRLLKKGGVLTYYSDEAKSIFLRCTRKNCTMQVSATKTLIVKSGEVDPHLLIVNIGKKRRF